MALRRCGPEAAALEQPRVQRIVGGLKPSRYASDSFPTRYRRPVQNYAESGDRQQYYNNITFHCSQLLQWRRLYAERTTWTRWGNLSDSYRWRRDMEYRRSFAPPTARDSSMLTSIRRVWMRSTSFWGAPLPWAFPASEITAVRRSPELSITAPKVTAFIAIRWPRSSARELTAWLAAPAGRTDNSCLGLQCPAMVHPGCRQRRGRNVVQ